MNKKKVANDFVKRYIRISKHLILYFKTKNKIHMYEVSHYYYMKTFK